MRLISATIENYRVHRRTTVTFAGGLTLIAAANESGKSTLVEAMHRGLFLPHRKGGELQREMMSRDGGHPTVEIHFAAAGSTWKLRKVFRGQQGTCSLVCEQPARQWEGDEAETKFAKLLSMHGASDADVPPIERWDHLWVMQGSAHGDPLGTTGASDLFAALAAGNAGTASLAPDDLALIDTVRTEVEATWGKRGQVLETSELGRLQVQVRDAEAAVTRATGLRSERQDLVDHLRLHQQTVRTNEPEVKNRRPALNDLAKQLEQSREEARQLKPARERVAVAEQALTDFDASVRQLEEHRATVAGLADAERDVVARCLVAARNVTDATTEEVQLAADVAQAQIRQQTLADQADLAEALSRERQLAAELDRLAQITKRRAALAALLDERRVVLTTLPVVTAKEIKQLRTLDGKLREDRASLASVAATICWQSGSGVVTAGGSALTLGEIRQITDTTEIVSAENRLVIRPGGGQDLVVLRDRIATAEQELFKRLAVFGVTTLDDLVALHDARESAERAVEEVAVQLAAQEDPQERIAEAASEQSRLIRQIELARTTNIAVPDQETKNSLRSQAEAQRIQVKLLSDAHAKIRDRVHVVAQLERDAQKAKEQIAEQRARAHGQLAGDEQRLGTPEARIRRRDELARTVAEMTALTVAVEAAVAERNPDEIEQRLQVMTRTLKRMEDELAGAQASVQLLARQLNSGTERDLEAEVDEANAQVGRLGRQAEAARLRADGIHLLYETLCLLRDDAREREEAPFIDAAGRYLDIVFRGARIGLETDGEARTLGVIDRTHAGFGSFTFDTLSRGTQELVAAAVRLAMAEVIAARRDDRCLPVVFDDAFANLDPGRLDRLGLLLDLARQRGLQMIVLTCNERDCGSLGEDAMVRLQRPRVASMESIAKNADDPAATAPASRPATRFLETTDGADRVAASATTSSQGVTAPSNSSDAAALLAQVPAGGSEISSRAVRSALDWDAERFNRVRDALVERGALIQPAGTRSLRRPS